MVHQLITVPSNLRGSRLLWQAKAWLLIYCGSGVMPFQMARQLMMEIPSTMALRTLHAWLPIMWRPLMAELRLLQLQVPQPRARPRAHQSPLLVPLVAALLCMANVVAPAGAVLRAVHQALADIRIRTTLSACPARCCFAGMDDEQEEMDAELIMCKLQAFILVVGRRSIRSFLNSLFLIDIMI